MPFSLQIKYSDKSFKSGEVVAIRNEGFVYFQGDCLKEWVASGMDPELFNGRFAIVYITDHAMNGSEVEVLDLLLPYSDEEEPEYQRKFYIKLPEDETDPNRVELLTTGETRVTWEFLSALKVAR